MDLPIHFKLALIIFSVLENYKNFLKLLPHWNMGSMFLGCDHSKWAQSKLSLIPFKMRAMFFTATWSTLIWFHCLFEHSLWEWYGCINYTAEVLLRLFIASCRSSQSLHHTFPLQSSPWPMCSVPAWPSRFQAEVEDSFSLCLVLRPQ